MKIAVVGATGLVGSKMIELLAESQLPINEIIPVASKKSLGQKVLFKEENYNIQDIDSAIALAPDIALFSAGADISLKKAGEFAKKGTVVIDNSSAWRMHPDVRLIVPEINGSSLTKEDKIIANPNCSTIQLVMVLKPLHDIYKIKRVVVSTYQAVSGSGQKGIEQLKGERNTQHSTLDKAYSFDIDLNVIPHIDIFLDNLYTKEEMKVINETQKILDDYSIKLTVTAVRVPVLSGHSESVNIEFSKKVNLNDIKKTLENFSGLKIIDNTKNTLYPMPKYHVGSNDVFVGRLRYDESQKNSVNLWIVADNLMKGAAGNAVQIAEYIYKKGLV
ncbi:MAG: aspartate-semialdehyde dehydrogenase [Solitalea-like symbiont of Tyrophagus putrescentiae]